MHTKIETFNIFQEPIDAIRTIGPSAYLEIITKHTPDPALVASHTILASVISWLSRIPTPEEYSIKKSIKHGKKSKHPWKIKND